MKHAHAVHRLALIGLFCALLAGLPFGAMAQDIPGGPLGEDLAAAKHAGLTSITGALVECAGGQADLFACADVNLYSFVAVSDLGGGTDILLNDLWGWTDPTTGREYALVGRVDGTAFVDVTDPVNPVFLGFLPLTSGARPSAWRDVKVYADHAFIVADGAGNHGMQVLDLRQLRGLAGPPVIFREDVNYIEFGSAHNLVINEDTGFAYAVGLSSGGQTCGRGYHMIDVRDPANPVFAGCFADAGTRRGYTHDAQCVVYAGPDAAYTGREVCFGANEDALSIADVTDKANPVSLAVGRYPDAAYVHQGWLSDDHRYFFQDDELDERAFSTNTRTIVWDVTDLDDPQVLTIYTAPNASIDHNQYVKGDRLYQANYSTGLRILNIADPANPREVAFFDTVPDSDAVDFRGAWSVYPFFESGTLIVSSRAEGLFVLQPAAGVELAAFAAVAGEGTAVMLEWTTSRERNTARFEISDRFGEGDFMPLATLGGAGNADTPQSYRFEATALAPGRHTFRLVAHSFDGNETLLAEETVLVVPGTHVLSALFPNPTADRATLTLLLRDRQSVRVAVYDAAGRRVTTLHDGLLDEGTEHRFSLDGTALAGGLYFVRAIGERFVETQELTIVR